MKIGFICGCWDLFHVGHVRAIKTAQSMCDKLYIGVNSDDFIMNYKLKKSSVNQEWRMKLIESLFGNAILVYSEDRQQIYDDLEINMIFTGDCWKGSDRYNSYENNNPEIKFVYIPVTKGISSTKIDGWVKQNEK